jgi:hypothetical protein
MRLTSCIAAALVLVLAPPAFAQEWEDFVFVEDGFSVNFPGRPKVENTTWKSQYGYDLPARIYSATRGGERYTATVVDYRAAEQQGIDRSKKCPPGAETCMGIQDGRKGEIIGLGYWKMDVRGAMAFALFKLMQRQAKLTNLNLEFQEVVEGYTINLTNPDESRTSAYITMHENRLYVLEGTTPKGAPEAGLFQGSVGFLDAKGNRIRYLHYYSNAVHGLRQHEPPAVRIGGAQALPPTGTADGGRPRGN